MTQCCELCGAKFHNFQGKGALAEHMFAAHPHQTDVPPAMSAEERSKDMAFAVDENTVQKTTVSNEKAVESSTSPDEGNKISCASVVDRNTVLNNDKSTLMANELPVDIDNTLELDEVITPNEKELVLVEETAVAVVIKRDSFDFDFKTFMSSTEGELISCVRTDQNMVLNNNDNDSFEFETSSVADDGMTSGVSVDEYETLKNNTNVMGTSLVMDRYAEVMTCVNCEQFESMLRQSNDTITEKEGQMLHYEHELNELKGHVNNFSTELSTKEERIKTLMQQLSLMQERCNAEEQKSKEYEKKLKSFSKQILENTTNMGRKGEEINNLESEKENLEKTVESLQHSLELCCTEKSQLKHQMKVEKEQNVSGSGGTLVSEELAIFKEEYYKSIKEMKDEMKIEKARVDKIEKDRGNESIRSGKDAELKRREKEIERREKREQEMKLDEREEDIERRERNLKKRERMGSGKENHSSIKANTLRYHNSNEELEEVSSDDDRIPIPYHKRKTALEKKIALSKIGEDNKKNTNITTGSSNNKNSKHDYNNNNSNRSQKSSNNSTNNNNDNNNNNNNNNKNNSGVDITTTNPPNVYKGKDHKTSIFSTSIIRNIKYSRFNNVYEHGYAKFHKFGGGLSRHMGAYMTTHLLEELPDTVIVQHGGNDLNQNTSDQDQLISKTANLIIDSALLCQNFEVQNVLVSSVPIRKGKTLQDRIEKLNGLLESMCRLNKLTFINNDNIKLEHLNKDGVHLNDDGTTMLADNYLVALYEIHNS